MRISELHIRNYRSIKAVDFEVPNVCALVGPNNAGKSNLLDALRRVLARDWGPRVGDFSEDDVYSRDPDLDIEISVTFDQPIPYSKLKDAEQVLIAGLQFTFDRYQRGDQAGQRRLEQRLIGTDGLRSRRYKQRMTKRASRVATSLCTEFRKRFASRSL